MATIKNGYTASADDVMNSLGIQMKNYAQLLYNAAYIGFNSKLYIATGAPNLNKIKYDVFLTETSTTMTDWFYDSTNKYYFNRVTSTANATDNNTSQTSTQAETLRRGFQFTMKANAVLKYVTKNASCTATTAYLYTTAGVLLATATFSGNVATFTKSWFLENGVSYYMEASSGGAGYTVTNVLSGSYPVVGTNLNVVGKVTSEGNTGTDDSFNFVSITTGPTTGSNTHIFQTTGLSTVTDCIATWNSSIDSDNTLTVSISADGTNYETVTDATIHRFTLTGTNLYIKFVLTKVDTAANDKISEYAIFYNLGAS